MCQICLLCTHCCCSSRVSIPSLSACCVVFSSSALCAVCNAFITDTHAHTYAYTQASQTSGHLSKCVCVLCVPRAVASVSSRSSASLSLSRARICCECWFSISSSVSLWTRSICFKLSMQRDSAPQHPAHPTCDPSLPPCSTTSCCLRDATYP